MKLFKLSVFALIVSCGERLTILPPNEYQTDLCHRLLQCELFEKENVPECVICTEHYLNTQTYTAQQLKEAIFKNTCKQVRTFAASSGIGACISNVTGE